MTSIVGFVVGAWMVFPFVASVPPVAFADLASCEAAKVQIMQYLDRQFKYSYSRSVCISTGAK